MVARTEKSQTIIACGVFRDELSEVVRTRFPHARLSFIDPRLDTCPDILFETVKRVVKTCARGERIVLVFGKCTPALDALTSERGISRVDGNCCYEILLGKTFSELLAEERGTYFLTPYLAANFKEAVWEKLGLHSPASRGLLFGRYTRIVLLDTGFCEGIEEAACTVSEMLGLPLIVLKCGIHELEKRVMEAVERASQD